MVDIRTKINPTFNDFAKAEETVAAIYKKLESNPHLYGDDEFRYGDMTDQFNEAYDTMVSMAYHLKLRGHASPETDAKMSQMVKRWLPVREKCERSLRLN